MLTTADAAAALARVDALHTALTQSVLEGGDLDRIAAEVAGVLGVGILTGAAAEWFATERLAGIGHKTVFSVLAFLVIGGVLAAHRFTGLRGRRAARLVLLAWLLLTLAYPGVKLVTDLLLP